jgi:hypothetical protein
MHLLQFNGIELPLGSKYTNEDLNEVLRKLEKLYPVKKWQNPNEQNVRETYVYAKNSAFPKSPSGILWNTTRLLTKIQENEQTCSLISVMTL